MAIQGSNSFVLGFAISGRQKAMEYWKGKDISEVLLQINLAAKDLRDFKVLSKERQETLIDFCVNLSSEISYYKKEYPVRLKLIA